jgi:tRNA threonylcarbamoyladenosine biosynthesis protein TsaB
MNIPLIPVDTLQIICAAIQDEIPTDALLCPMLDARRMEVYTAMYTPGLDAQTEVVAKVIDEQSFAEELLSKNIYFFGDGAEKCQSVIASANAHFLTGILPQAKYMGKLAENATALDIKQMAYYEPFYLKEFVPAPSHIKGLK